MQQSSGAPVNEFTLHRRSNDGADTSHSQRGKHVFGSPSDDSDEADDNSDDDDNNDQFGHTQQQQRANQNALLAEYSSAFEEFLHSGDMEQLTTWAEPRTIGSAHV